MKKDLASLEIRCELGNSRLIQTFDVADDLITSHHDLLAYTRHLREVSRCVRETSAEIREMATTIRGKVSAREDDISGPANTWLTFR